MVLNHNQGKTMFEPTKIQMLTAVVEGNGRQEMTSAVRALTIRLPVHVYAAVQALSEMSQTTKGAMVVNLIDAALEELSSTLSPETRKEFLQLQGERLHDLVSEQSSLENDFTSMGLDPSKIQPSADSKTE